MVDQQNLIEAKGLRCHSVGPLDLSVAGGRCLALTGPSGSGKSLMMRMMADLVPHEGSCSLDGVSADTVAPPLWRSWVRYVAAEPGWWEGTVGAHFRKPAAQIPLFQRLHLDPAMLDMVPARLSTGERQRVAFLRAIEDRPRVLLLDEPTSALDSDATIIVESIIRERLAEGCAAVVTSHDPAQVERLADAVIRLGTR